MPESEVEKAIVSVEEHARLRRDLADAGEQFTATSEVLAALGRHASDPDAVLGTILESARRLCNAQAAALSLLDGDVYRLSRAFGLSDEFVRPRRPCTRSNRTAALSSVVSGSTAGRSRSPTCWPTRDYGRHGPPARSPATGRLMAAPMLARRRGRRRRCRCGATEVEPVRRARRWRSLGAFAGAGRDRGATASNLVQQLEARSAELAEKVEQLEALREVGEAVSSSLDLDQVLVDHRHARRRALRHRRRLDHGVRRGATAASRCAASTAPSPARRRAAARASGSTSTRRSSGGRPGRAARSRCPTSTQVELDPHLQILYDDGWRSVLAVPMLREGQIVGALVVRRKPTGDFSEETLDLLRDVRQPVGAGAPQRPALPRARGARAPSWRSPAGTSRSSWRACRTSCGRRSTPSRLLRGAAGADVRRPQRTPGGVPPRHPRARASTCSSCSTRSSTCPRSRPDGWSWSYSTFDLRAAARVRRRRMLRERAAAARHRPRRSTSTADVGARRRRRAPAQAGPAQPAHATRSSSPPTAARVAVRAAATAARARRHGHRHRDRRPRGGPGADLRVVPAGRPRRARARRAPGSASPCRRRIVELLGGRHVAGERGRRGQHVRLLDPAATAGADERAATVPSAADRLPGRRDRGRPAVARPVHAPTWTGAALEVIHGPRRRGGPRRGTARPARPPCSSTSGCPASTAGRC